MTLHPEDADDCRRRKLRCTEMALLTVLIPGLIAFLLPVIEADVDEPLWRVCMERLRP
jgi:hypothetical protein